MMPAPHIPVLLDEVITALTITPGECHVDGTFGAGGYTQMMLAAGASVIAFDRDPSAIAAGAVDQSAGLTLIEACFSQMADMIEGPVDGITLDIGVSSMQLDQGARGFSFQNDGPLDMRMSQTGQSAADFLNNADEAEIARIIYEYGDEPKSRRIAHGIIDARPITRTGELARIVRRATGWRDGDKKDPATRTFQAIRIHINHELEELEGGLEAAERALKPGGRFAVVTFHSLEDRMVKRFMRERSGANPGTSRHMPSAVSLRPTATFDRVSKPIRASEAEIARNPRSRSATLRVAHRTAAPPWVPVKKGLS